MSRSRTYWRWAGGFNRYRGFRVDGEPVATGFAAVGDAWACSNPSLGRGMSLALCHVQNLREGIREHVEDPRRFADAWDAMTEAQVTPWYREPVEEDHARMAEIEALRQGLAPPTPSGSAAALLPALRVALARDPDAFASSWRRARA